MNAHGQPDLLGDSYERHSKRGAEQHEKNPPAGAGGRRRLRARSRRRRGQQSVPGDELGRRVRHRPDRDHGRERCTTTSSPATRVVFRAYAVDGKNHEDPDRGEVLLRDDPRPAERQVQVRPEVEDGARAVRVDRHLDGSVARTRSGTVNFKVLVQSKTKRRGSFVQMPVATSQLTITNTPPATGTTPPAAIVARRPARTTRSSTPTASTGRVPQALRRGRSAARRPTCSSAASSSCSARGASTSKTKTVLSLDNVTEAHFTVPGQPNVTLNWGSHGDGEGLLLDERLEHPGDVPARRHRPCRSATR